MKTLSIDIETYSDVPLQKTGVYRYVDYNEIADEIFRLQELRQKTTVDTAARDEQIKRINDLQDYIAQQTTYLTEFDEPLVRRWIKQITIWDDHITVELKSGVSIDVDA